MNKNPRMCKYVIADFGGDDDDGGGAYYVLRPSGRAQDRSTTPTR